MASVYIPTDPLTEIDYSLVDRRVRSFRLCGKLLYDEEEGVSQKEWKPKLVKFVIDHGLNINHGHGLHAFVNGLINEGLVEEVCT